MPTTTLANRSNFIRWNKVNGPYAVSTLPSVKLPSADSPGWKAKAAPKDNAWRDIIFNEDTWVSVSDADTESVMVSEDNGKSWQLYSSADNAENWRDLAYGNGTYVAIGTLGANQVMTSSDAKTWTIRTAATTQGWNSVTYGNGLFVAVASSGASRVMTSPDGITWTSRTASAANAWQDVTFGNGLFVAVASSGTNRVMTSPDGITWTGRVEAEANSWLDVVYGNGVYVAVSNNGTNRVQYSSDGITWNSALAAEQNAWQSVTFGLDIFYAVAGTGNSRVMYSLDNGQTWASENATEDNSWQAVEFGNDGWIAISSNGTNRIMRNGFKDNPTKYGNENQYNDVDNCAVTLFCGDTFSFYANLDTLDNLGTFDSWRLDLVDANSFVTQYYGIASLSQDFIAGYDYRFYLDSYEVSSSFQEGTYRMVIVDTSDDSVIYISNQFNIAKSIAPYTKRIRYRNPLNILNFNYETLTSFKNEMRIDLVQRQPNYPTNRIGYTLVSGSFNPVRTTEGSNYEFITQAYEDLDHEAWSSSTIQTLEILNENSGLWEEFRRTADSNYDVEWNNNDPRGDGTIRLEQVNTFSSNRNV